MSEQQDMKNIISELVLDTSVMSLILINLISREAKSSSDKDAWLRSFADEVHSSIDSGPIPPISIQAKVENARARIDFFMQAVGLRLARE